MDCFVTCWIASSLRSSQRQGQEMLVVATANKVKREATHSVGNIEKKWIASSLAELLPPRFARGRLIPFLNRTYVYVVARGGQYRAVAIQCFLDCFVTSFLATTGAGNGRRRGRL
jgi:hypothetical protein